MPLDTLIEIHLLRPQAGPFRALEPRRHRLLHELNPVRQVVLSHSPEAHQNFAGSPPGLCSGAHQKLCDLEGVEGEAPPNIHSLKP